MKLDITINPTADGAATYMQIMSDDYISVNIVLVASDIRIRDTRGTSKATVDAKRTAKG